MCSVIQTAPIAKVPRGSFRLLSTRRAKSVIIKLKQWVKKLKNTEGAGVELTGDSDDVIERQNVNNENKSNVVKSNMTYTIEELKEIVDDNLANELREIEARSAQE